MQHEATFYNHMYMQALRKLLPFCHSNSKLHIPGVVNFRGQPGSPPPPSPPTHQEFISWHDILVQEMYSEKLISIRLLTFRHFQFISPVDFWKIILELTISCDDIFDNIQCSRFYLKTGTANALCYGFMCIIQNAITNMEICIFMYIVVLCDTIQFSS